LSSCAVRLVTTVQKKGRRPGEKNELERVKKQKHIVKNARQRGVRRRRLVVKNELGERRSKVEKRDTLKNITFSTINLKNITTDG
jgi:hypothetical protein